MMNNLFDWFLRGVSFTAGAFLTYFLLISLHGWLYG